MICAMAVPVPGMLRRTGVPACGPGGKEQQAKGLPTERKTR